jgi:hypothetical protein
MSSSLGYIVVEEMGGGPCVLLTRDNSVWKNVPAGGICLSDTRETTVFPTRALARAAIRRTWAYWGQLNRKGNWPDDAYTIRRLEPAKD